MHGNPLVRLTSRWFCAGVVFDRSGHVSRCASILGYIKDWSQERVLRYARNRCWVVEPLGVPVKLSGFGDVSTEDDFACWRAHRVRS
jgi:hypothetical protein